MTVATVLVMATIVGVLLMWAGYQILRVTDWEASDDDK